MEENLGSILMDAALPSETKSGLLYYSAKNVVKDVLRDPRSGESIQRSRHLVENTVNYLFAEKTAFEHLLKVTSYDYYTYTHSVNVFVFSLSLALRMGESDLVALREFGDGALMHDVGKTLLDPATVNNRGTLTEEQWASMRMHPVYGYEILREHPDVSAITLDVVRHHHEKIKGGGYPDGLRGDEVSRWVRMCALCDVFDALTTERSYKRAMPTFPALRMIKDECVGDLDPELFAAFVDLMGHPSGR